MAEKEQEKKPAKAEKPAPKRGNERPAWAMHDNPGNPGKGPGGRKGGGFVQRIKKGSARGR